MLHHYSFSLAREGCGRHCATLFFSNGLNAFQPLHTESLGEVEDKVPFGALFRTLVCVRHENSRSVHFSVLEVLTWWLRNCSLA